MELEKNEQALERIKNCLRSQHIELVDFKEKKSRNRFVLTFLVDKEYGGITASECAKLNNQIALLLDECQWPAENYLLEVSSPGVDRPLISKEDFKRNIGREAVIYAQDGSMFQADNAAGTIKCIEEEMVVIEDKDKKEIRIPVKFIKMAKVKLKWQVNE